MPDIAIGRRRRIKNVAFLWILIASIAASANAGEGFGRLEKVVEMDRMTPPEVVLARQQCRLVFDDRSGHAALLRQRIDTLIRSGDPKMRITADAPFVLTVSVERFLDGRTRAIEGKARLADRQDRELFERMIHASNAGALISDSDEELIGEAASTVAQIIVPLRVKTAAVVPKGRLDPMIPFAARGDWQAYLAALDRLPAMKGPSDAYRQYALALAHEGVAYKSVDAGNLEGALPHLREAIAYNLAAARMNPSEKLFSEQYEPMRRAFSTPGTPPSRWIDPHAMERWESMLRIRRWSSARGATPGVLDNQGVLDLFCAGHSDEQILGQISRATRAGFALGDLDMTALHSAGVSWPVIDAMRSKAGLPRRPFRITPDKW